MIRAALWFLGLYLAAAVTITAVAVAAVEVLDGRVDLGF